jgi:hypothetical protein
LLQNKLLNRNSGGDTSFLSPSFGLGGVAFATRSTSLLAQNDHVIRPLASGLLAKNSSLKDLQHKNNALADSTAFRGFALRPQHGKAKKITQLLNNGGHSDGDVPRPPKP